MLKKIKVMELSINGQMSLWDPATSGIIYGLSQWVRSYPISPVDIRIYPLFYPDESAAICHLKIKFCVASILYLMFRERHIWKPMISGNR
ncbi:hypothetical protein JW835_13905 [bacterium]|nr:hypothetical protein [bacterium]